ncbi:MAG: archaemetzincin family Zn-dependent metalloprotease [Desulfobacterales bacterium]|nr:archaemetzincin family Zn-dependent metalloprotease [Desulfobacterales bacterium]
MSKYVTICPLGFVEEYILACIAGSLEEKHDIECRISANMEDPEYAYNERRDQYDSKLILKHLINSCPEDAAWFMGVTRVDLYVPILKYVYGLAQMKGRCSVISIHRLRPQYYDQRANNDLLLERVEKTASHELGHLLGLTHCRDRRCIMHSSTRIQDTDFKQASFCPTCAELFKWYLQKHLVP